MTEPTDPGAWTDLTQLGRRIERMHVDQSNAILHSQRELAAAPAELESGWPTSLRVGGGGDVSDKVGNHATQRSEMKGDVEDMRDRGIELARAVYRLEAAIAKVRFRRLPDKAQLPGLGDPDVEAAKELLRCKVPNCGDLASTHRLETGIEVDGWCDKHFPVLCSECHDELREPDRTIGSRCKSRKRRHVEEAA